MDTITRSTLIACCLSILLALSIQKALKWYKILTFFSKRGLKTPKLWFLAGNLPEILLKPHPERDRCWTKSLGKVYGLYFGLQPQLVIADPKILNQIAVKDFDAFTNTIDTGLMNPIMRRFLLALKDDDWRRVRGLLTPTFVSGKLGKMYQMLELCAQDLELNLTEHLATSATSFEPKDLFSLYTLDSINTCCYGLKIKRSGYMSLEAATSIDELVRLGVQSFKTDKLNLILYMLLPAFVIEWLQAWPFPIRYTKPIADKLYSIIKDRRANPKLKHADYLQAIMDAVDSGRDQTQPELSGKLFLTDDEMISQAVMILLAGLETTGNLLTHCHYALAFHPEVQLRLYNELDAIRSFDSDSGKYYFELEQLSSCKYLDAVLCETLRRLPAPSWVTRIAGREYPLGSLNFTIPEGMIVHLALSSVMNDPDYWKDPDKFDPERFMPGQQSNIVPGAFCPFGMGPRSCIGRRFAMLEAKLAVAMMVTKFHFYPVSGSQFPGEFHTELFVSKMKQTTINAKLRPLIGKPSERI